MARIPRNPLDTPIARVATVRLSPTQTGPIGRVMRACHHPGAKGIVVICQA
jgi:hypothetical protein